MMRKLTTLILLTCCLFINLTSMASDNGQEVTNLSNIKVTWLERTASQWCHGQANQEKNGHPINLAEIGINEQTLLNGINCVAGDFDGNGYLDFLLFGEYIDKPPVVAHPKHYMVLMYDKHLIIRKLIQAKYGLNHPLLYTARADVGEFGEPATKNDGFYEPGEGGTTYIFLYNKKTERFDISEFGSEYH